MRQLSLVKVHVLLYMTLLHQTQTHIGAHTTPEEEEISSSRLYPSGNTSQDECTVVKCPCGYDEVSNVACVVCD